MVAAAATDARRDDGAEELPSSAGVDGVPSPGRYIKEQRKRQGMSIDQLAAATKIPRSSLELLESDHHESLPGPVFVKGFLRCCARALGLEAEVVMELVYERERELLLARRRERPTGAAAASPAETAATRVDPAGDNPAADVPAADPASGEATSPLSTDAEGADQPNASAAGPSHVRGEGLDLFAGFRRVVGRGGVSMMLWVAVALFVAMVMMAAFNLLGVSPIGPT